jgi:hypothetical protein
LVLFALAIVPAVFAIVLYALVDASDAVLTALTLLLWPTVGVLIAVRRSENPLGWIFCGAGIAGSIGGLGGAYVQYATSTSRALPADTLFVWLASVVNNSKLLAGFTFICLLFPTGKLLSRRWRLLVWLAAASYVVSYLYQGFAVDELVTDDGVHFRNPLYVATFAHLLKPLQPFAFAAGLLILVASVLSVGLRLRRSRGIERQQLKWFVYVAALSITSFLLAGICASIDPTNQGGFIGGVFWFTALLGIELGLPAVVGLAIVRYRLYEIDRLINRTLVYSLLTAILVGADLLLVVVIERLFQPVASGSDLVVAGSTLAVAAFVQPLRRRIQSTVDHRFYRRKYDATRTLETFSARLRDEIDLDALTSALQATVVETMQPTHVSMWLRSVSDGSGAPIEARGAR